MERSLGWRIDLGNSGNKENGLLLETNDGFRSTCDSLLLRSSAYARAPGGDSHPWCEAPKLFRVAWANWKKSQGGGVVFWDVCPRPIPDWEKAHMKIIRNCEQLERERIEWDDREKKQAEYIGRLEREIVKLEDKLRLSGINHKEWESLVNNNTRLRGCLEALEKELCEVRAKFLPVKERRPGEMVIRQSQWRELHSKIKELEYQLKETGETNAQLEKDKKSFAEWGHKMFQEKQEWISRYGMPDKGGVLMGTTYNTEQAIEELRAENRAQKESLEWVREKYNGLLLKVCDWSMDMLLSGGLGSESSRTAAHVIFHNPKDYTLEDRKQVQQFLDREAQKLLIGGFGTTDRAISSTSIPRKDSDNA